jgi:hypothetical protein
VSRSALGRRRTIGGPQAIERSNGDTGSVSVPFAHDPQKRARRTPRIPGHPTDLCQLLGHGFDFFFGHLSSLGTI